MKTQLSKFGVTLAVILFGVIGIGTASGSCGDFAKIKVRPSLMPQSGTRGAGYLMRVDDDQDATIVGMWHVTFTAKTQNGSSIPDTVIDNALVVWHRDKTEIMNSARPPQDGDFCLGVWERTGRSTYKLNHFAWLANDTANAPYGIGNPSGPTHIVEEVVLSPDRVHYSGSFTLTAYDTSGKVAVSFTGVLAATRVTVQTTVQDLLSE